jgi:hypothetical protein
MTDKFIKNNGNKYTKMFTVEGMIKLLIEDNQIELAKIYQESENQLDNDEAAKVIDAIKDIKNTSCKYFMFTWSMHINGNSIEEDKLEELDKLDNDINALYLKAAVFIQADEIDKAYDCYCECFKGGHPKAVEKIRECFNGIDENNINKIICQKNEMIDQITKSGKEIVELRKKIRQTMMESNRLELEQILTNFNNIIESDIIKLQKKILKNICDENMYQKYEDLYKISHITPFSFLYCYYQENVFFEKFVQICIECNVVFECLQVLSHTKTHNISEPVMELVIKNIDDINRQDKNGETLLHVSTRCDCERCNNFVRFLLSQGIDEKINNNSGFIASDISKINRDHKTNQ